MKECINPPTIAVPGGAFSQCVRRGSLVFISGMTGVDRERRLVAHEAAAQTHRALENLLACVEAVGGTRDDVCSVTTYLEDADRDFAAYNEVFREFFPADPPARATVGAHMIGGALVEIQAIAVIE
jgi:2-iminobutanoate/2-iminopropanoate deaminase